MDSQRFDALARSLAQRHTRRGVLGGLAALAAGAVGLRGAGAACPAGQVAARGVCVCKATGRPPGADGLCPCPSGKTRCGQTCVDLARDVNNCGTCGYACPPASTVGTCAGAPVCRAGTCMYRSLAAGTPCDDGKPCTEGDVCNGEGSCAGTPKICTALDQCHVAGACDPATGVCSNLLAPDGTACDDGNPATVDDVCTGGVCAGIDRCAEVVCTALDQCHVAGTCAPATGNCSNPNKADGTSCNDGSACTQGDTCQAGVCTGGSALTCTTAEPCLEAYCDPASGCQTRPKPEGTSCGDSNTCNGAEVCNATGQCVSGSPVSCGACLRCNAANGSCEPDPTQVGQSCTPAQPNACFGGFQCNASGVCAGVNPVVCTAQDQCHTVGTCNPATGTCSNPRKPNGTACDDGNPATENDVCTNGVCAGTPVNVCSVGMGPCFSQDTVSCGAHGDDCFCHTGIAGTTVCTSGVGGCFPCASDDDCSGTTVCVQQPCCSSTGTACVEPCAAANACDGVDCSTPPDRCHTAGTCIPSLGTCAYPERPNGTSCSDGTPGTAGHVCVEGECGPDPCAGVTCPARDRCHTAGTCTYPFGRCTEPVLPDGTNCSDGTPATAGHVCSNGTCGPDPCTGVSCPVGQACSSGRCVSVICTVGMGPCFSQETEDCADGCFCHTTFGGSTVCTSGVGGCFPCASDDDCSGTTVCVQQPCCSSTGSACVEPCA